MLKPSPQHRPSPASSPVFHYAPASRSVPSSPLLRRDSTSRASFASRTPPQRPHPRYVDVGTQWTSPVMNTRPGKAAQEPSVAKVERAQGVASSASAPPIPTPAATQPTALPESPGLKRRQSQGTAASLSNTLPITVPAKRAKSDQAVKILPQQYEFCAVEDMVVLIANMIQELIQTNDNLPPRTGTLTRFHSRTPPGISVHDYLQRLAKHATLTPPLLLSMVYYIDRLCLLYPAFTVTTLTVHRFLITAATVAAKGLSDSFWNNATYARVGGIKIAELGLLELDFLYRVDWKIVPNPEALVDYYNGLVERSAGYTIESDSSSLDDDDDEDAEDDSDDLEGSSPEEKTEATDTKWKAWMDDVSAHKDGSPEGAAEGKGKIAAPAGKAA